MYAYGICALTCAEGEIGSLCILRFSQGCESIMWLSLAALSFIVHMQLKTMPTVE
jgi:hypothetical protein